jgi:hypothetical protein
MAAGAANATAGPARFRRGEAGGQGMDETELRARLHALKEEHRDLDVAIEALSRQATADMMQIARLKKRKLRLKDEIMAVQDLLIPDIIA